MLRFKQPQADATVSGFADIELELADVAPSSVLYWGVDEEELQPTKALASILSLHTPSYTNGTHTIRAELRVGDEVIVGASRELNFDNPDFDVVSFGLSQESYQAGELLEVTLEYSRAGLEISAEMTELDPGYDGADLEVTDQGDGTYLLRYEIPEETPVESGTHTIHVTARDDSGRSLTEEISIRLRQEPLVPFAVNGAAYLDNAPPELQASEGFPELTLSSPPIPLLTGTSKTFVVTWDEDTLIDRLLIAMPGGHGYYVQAVAPDAREASVVLENLKPETSGALEVEFAAIDPSGANSGWQTTVIQVADVGLGGLQLTLFWDAPVDLDLSVIDPAKKLLDFANPSSNGGVLNLDANARCEIGPTFAENISWASGEALLGDYEIRVNLFENCGYSGPINWWIVGVAGAASEESFKPSAGSTPNVSVGAVNLSGMMSSADTDQSGTGVSAGPPVTVDTTQSVGGVIKYKARPQKTFKDVPVRFAPVHAKSVTDGSELGRTRTDATGTYSMTLNNPNGHDYQVVVEAVYQRVAGGIALAQVLDQTGAIPYSATSPAVKPKQGVSEVVNIAIKPEDNSGAFNIVDNLRQGYDWVFSRSANATLGPLAARWARGMASGSSYSRAMKRIQLNGAVADPDEFDDSVIIHEFMHYVYDQIVQKTPPGGSHDGTRTDPAQAFSEGLATGLAQQVLGTAVYLDKTDDNKKLNKTNIESNTEAQAKGQGPAGEVSEYLVAMVVWDLFDGANETHDRLAEAKTTADTYLFDLGSRSDRGPTNVDLVDLLDGWRCRTKSTVASGTFRLDTELKKLLDERAYTYDFIGNPSCP